MIWDFRRATPLMISSQDGLNSGMKFSSRKNRSIPILTRCGLDVPKLIQKRPRNGLKMFLKNSQKTTKKLRTGLSYAFELRKVAKPSLMKTVSPRIIGAVLSPKSKKRFETFPSGFLSENHVLSGALLLLMNHKFFY